jgi:hypothetical protein
MSESLVLILILVVIRYFSEIMIFLKGSNAGAFIAVIASNRELANGDFLIL